MKYRGLDDVAHAGQGSSEMYGGTSAPWMHHEFTREFLPKLGVPGFESWS